jgi:dienelactone hydrolase
MSEAARYRDGEVALHGVLERPDKPNGRAVMVVHEADGLGRNARRRARMLADLGYLALAADLFGDSPDPPSEDGLGRMHALRADPHLFRRRVRAGFDFLAGQKGVDPLRIAAIGYCFGGTAVLELARSGAPVAAVVSFHGLLRSDLPARPGEAKARILACTGARDPLVPLADISAFQAEMDGAGADWQLIAYGRALHSFTNPNVEGMGDPRMAYDPSADRQSWAAALLFLDEALA